MGSTTTIAVFACDAQPIVLEGLARVLSATSDIVLAGSAHSPADALPLLAQLRPRIVLFDHGAGLKAAFRFLGELKTVVPTAFSVLWATDLAEVESFRALQLGARAVIRKSLPVSTLLDCLRAVANGDIWMENSVSDQVVGFLSRRNTPRLTPREREIVRCLCQGMRNKEIAQALAITPGTVKVHLMHIFEKTGVKDRFELAAHGRRMLGLDDSEAAS